MTGSLSLSCPHPGCDGRHVETDGGVLRCRSCGLIAESLNDPDTPAVTEVEFTGAIPGIANLAGFARCTIDDDLALEPQLVRVGVRVRVVFPTRRDRQRARHLFVRPADERMYAMIETAILDALELPGPDLLVGYTTPGRTQSTLDDPRDHSGRDLDDSYLDSFTQDPISFQMDSGIGERGGLAIIHVYGDPLFVPIHKQLGKQLRIDLREALTFYFDPRPVPADVLGVIEARIADAFVRESTMMKHVCPTCGRKTLWHYGNLTCWCGWQPTEPSPGGGGTS
jgi:hypothetical protein